MSIAIKNFSKIDLKSGSLLQINVLEDTDTCIETIQIIRACSSVGLEQSAHNGLVGGSSPSGPTIFFKLIYIQIDISGL